MSRRRGRPPPPTREAMTGGMSDWELQARWIALMMSLSRDFTRYHRQLAEVLGWPPLPPRSAPR